MRADHDLAFILKYENVAWFEDGKVRILDRRIYPIRTEFVTCSTYREVAQAITDMVTQSYGPYQAAAMGMALAAYELRDKTGTQILNGLEEAAQVLAHARPTTALKMEQITHGCMKAARAAVEKGECVHEMIMAHAVQTLDEKYTRIEKIGEYFAAQVPVNGTVMTQCYAETDIGMILRALKKNNNPARIICPETRPYFQGARLTASVACDMGFDVTVITDNMPGYVLKEKKVDVFTSAADVITIDGHVVNKVGTFQIALCAQYYGIPYYVTGIPDIRHPDMDNVRIEERDPELVLHALDVKTTMPGVKGFYPAFDVTPPELIRGVVTEKGILLPTELKTYFE